MVFCYINLLLVLQIFKIVPICTAKSKNCVKICLNSMKLLDQKSMTNPKNNDFILLMLLYFCPFPLSKISPPINTNLRLSCQLPLNFQPFKLQVLLIQEILNRKLSFTKLLILPNPIKIKPLDGHKF